MAETQSNIIFRPFMLTLLHYNYNNVEIDFDCKWVLCSNSNRERPQLENVLEKRHYWGRDDPWKLRLCVLTRWLSFQYQAGHRLEWLCQQSFLLWSCWELHQQLFSPQSTHSNMISISSNQKFLHSAVGLLLKSRKSCDLFRLSYLPDQPYPSFLIF